ncbi:MAG: hypothetical protein VW644_07855 [Alphaproteobacteria bacterium]
MSISKKAKKKAGKGSRKDNEEAIRNMRADFQIVSSDSDSKPKKSFKTLILVAVVLIVVGAGAGGVWMFLLHPPAEEVAEPVAEPPDEVFAKIYIKTDPVHIAFQRSDGRRRRLIVFLTLEVEQKDNNVSEVNQALPRLQEAYWRTLNAEPLPGAERDAIALDIVKQRVRAVSEEVLGPDIVHDVLISDARSIAG